MGDPAGIGPEIIAKGFSAAREYGHVVVIGDADVMRAALDICEISHQIETCSEPADAPDAPGIIPVIDLDNVEDLDRGIVASSYGRASLEYLERAIDLASTGMIDAITTAPINKQSIGLAGSEHAGHTGLLAARTNTTHYSMMLVEKSLRVTHVSTHVPLREACDLVTERRVFETIRVTDEALKEFGIRKPTIAVAGLNPHAGDGGLMGSTEAEEIEPAIQRARQEGIDVFGPEPPDTIYIRAADGHADCVVSMYHDQGHIPIKMMGFTGGESISGVNVTIGLPIVRTSVDHGTAFDIAGTGQASETSLVEAVEVASQLARSRGQ